MKHRLYRFVRPSRLLISDIVLLLVAAYLSFMLRLEQYDMGKYWVCLALFAASAVLITPLTFRSYKVYVNYWRYASVQDMLLLCRALTVAVSLITLMNLGVAVATDGRVGMPRSIPFIFFLLAMAATGGPRFLLRALSTRGGQQPRPTYTGPERRRQRVLIMGAGAAASMIVRELQQNAQLRMDVVGLLDDDPRKYAMRVHGLPVLGNYHDIPRLVTEHTIQQVIIAMPSASGKTIRAIVDVCKQAGIGAKSIPGMFELLDGTVPINRLRDIGIEDLLRRAPIETDIAAVRDLLRGRRVLVTGGGGSIGSELCRQVLRCQPSELIVLGHGENSVFEIHNELLKQQGASLKAGSINGTSPTHIKTVIADIRFPKRIRSVFEQLRPEIVFHAAAHKHVPLMELNPSEAITNNVLGTRNVLEAAKAVGVDHFVMISTDKAVNPTSIMGAAKRTGELLVHQAACHTGKSYVAVRFGNVLGSRGSVVLTFKQQISAGGPVTVTDTEMCRFFMTIPEAVQLLLQAAVLGKGGEVFVLDMGEPVKIIDLAHDVIRLSGLKVGEDIDIAVTGLRPGEKLFEELFIAGEEYDRTCHQKIFIAAHASKLVPYNLEQAIADLTIAAERDDATAIRQGLQRLIPEFQPQRALQTRQAITPSAGLGEVLPARPLPVLEVEALA